MKTLYCFIVLILILGCSKKDTCNQRISTHFGFKTYEYILDTLMQADTVFAERDITFITNEVYSNIKWTIGNDQRVFTSFSVQLRFTNPDNIQARLTADTYNSNCNLETKLANENLTILKNDGTIVSPLAGTYLGFNQDNPRDTFWVNINFWIGSRYPWWSRGAYSIDNLPKGYIDSTQNWNGYQRPEIKGIISTPGYKNMAFDKSGFIPAQGIKGYAFLKRGFKDTLVCNYRIIDTATLRQNGQISYIQKTFTGIKQ